MLSTKMYKCFLSLSLAFVGLTGCDNSRLNTRGEMQHQNDVTDCTSSGCNHQVSCQPEINQPGAFMFSPVQQNDGYHPSCCNGSSQDKRPVSLHAKLQSIQIQQQAFWYSLLRSKNFNSPAPALPLAGAQAFRAKKQVKLPQKDSYNWLVARPASLPSAACNK